MKVPQFRYLSDQAMALRRRDGTPPHGVHVCELDSLDPPADHDHGAFAASYRAAAALRAEIEGNE